MTEPGIVHAFGDDALGADDATGLAERIAAGEVSPVEAVEAAIARLERVDPHLNALVQRDYDRAVERAERWSAPWGAFGGVPALAKDDIRIAGLPMRMGSRAVPTRPSPTDGAFTEQLRSTGVQLLGTTTLPEFGWTASTERADGEVTRNPWRADHSCGGSSGGSAALVAAGAVPIAHGTDGGGSVRIPAAACGLVGLKPSRGRLRVDKATAAMPIKIVTPSVLTRSVRDTAGFFTAAEAAYRNPHLPPIGTITGPSSRRLRIAVTIDSPLGSPTDAATRAAVERMATLLTDLGHDVIERRLRLPRTFRSDFEDYWALLAYAVATRGQRLFGPGFDKTALDPVTLGLAARARRRLPRMPLVIARLAATTSAHTRSLGDADVTLTPVLSHTTPRIGHLSADLPFEEHFDRLTAYVGFTPWHNASSAPAISLPGGLDADGVPIGVMFGGHHGAERTLLELAYEIEAAAPFPRIADHAPTA